MRDVLYLGDVGVRCPCCGATVMDFDRAVEHNAYWGECLGCGARVGLRLKVTATGGVNATTRLTPDTVREMG